MTSSQEKAGIFSECKAQLCATPQSELEVSPARRHPPQMLCPEFVWVVVS